MDKVGAKNAIDIFCGKHHSFYIDKDHKVYAFGLNNHGQLGIGNKFNVPTPTHIKGLDPDDTDYVV